MNCTRIIQSANSLSRSSSRMIRGLPIRATDPHSVRVETSHALWRWNRTKFRGCSIRRRREINDSGLLETRPSVAFSSPRRTGSMRMFSAWLVLARRMDTIVALRSNRGDWVQQRERCQQLPFQLCCTILHTIECTFGHYYYTSSRICRKLLLTRAFKIYSIILFFNNIIVFIRH